MPQSKRVTMNDVAKLANVSRALVSRVLNNDASLSIKDETRKRVLKAAHDLHYRPNALAQSLRLRKTGVVGLLVPNVSNPFFSQIIRGISEVLLQNGLMCIVCDTFESNESALRYVKLLDDRQVDGLIVATAEIKDKAIEYLERQGIKYVYATRYSKSSRAPYVVIDTYDGIRQTTRHLIEIGHKKIAHITGNQKTQTGAFALQAYKDEMREHGLSIDLNYIIETNYLETSGYTAMKEILDRDILPTAVVGCTDSVAINAIRAIHDGGLKVPEDIAVTGYSNTWAAIAVNPPLTTVDAPLYDIGSVSAKMLIDLLDDKTLDEREIIIKPKLVVRESTVKS